MFLTSLDSLIVILERSKWKGWLTMLTKSFMLPQPVIKISAPLLTKGSRLHQALHKSFFGM